MSDYVFNNRTKEIWSTKTKCTAQECKETGCCFPDCSEEYFGVIDRDEFDQLIDELKAEGKTVTDINA